MNAQDPTQPGQWALVVSLSLLSAALAVSASDKRSPSIQAQKDDPDSFVVLTFNVGTTPGLRHDDSPDDGYTSREAKISDTYYGNGLAWSDAIESVRLFIARTDPDIVAFQEIFDCDQCADIPADARAGFVCENWKPGDPGVPQLVLGDAYQIACHPGKSDKCVAVHRRFGTLRGKKDQKAHAHALKGCGSGARVARFIIDRTNGESLTLISVHGTSGMSRKDQDCRVRQVEQIFVDFGDGTPAANGETNLILGDFNTDPGKLSLIDASAKRWNDFVGDGKSFRFISKVGPSAPRAYQRIADVDHVVSDVFEGTCSYPGVDEGTRPVFAGTYFDHKPVVCTLKRRPNTGPSPTK